MEAAIGGLATGAVRFRTTAWSVLQAEPAEPERRAAAFDYLFRAYWQPVYSLYRRVYRATPEEARDLTQGLFLHLMGGALDRADRDRARFRTFLKTVARNWYRDERKRRSEGGAFAPGQWTGVVDPEGGLDVTDPDLLPEQAFERDFARCVVRQAFASFAAECAQSGREVWARAVERRWIDPPDDRTRGTVDTIARELDLAPAELSRVLYKAKQAFRRHLLDEVRGTLVPHLAADPAEVEAEVGALLRALSGGG